MALARDLQKRSAAHLVGRPDIVNSSKRASLTARGAFIFLGIGSLVAPGLPVLAHHAFAAEYDAGKPIDLAGVVTKAKWVNPHSWLFFDVPGDGGTVTNWGVELGAPNSLALKGLLKADLQPGAKVHIKGYLAKAGGAFGYAVTLSLGDGRTFQTGGAQDAPPTASPSGAQ
jgi:hypothetical protein